MKMFTDANELGFLPQNNGQENQKALQAALDSGGTIVVSCPGEYALSGTVYIGSDTSLICGNGVYVKKVNDCGGFTHVILNKGALKKQYDHHISIENLQIMVNGVDCLDFAVFGLRGQLGFFYVKDLKITGFRCMDLGEKQYGIHICTFRDVLVDDVKIRGDKDGVHLGCGKRFTIRNGVFQTFDDAIALNAHDYDTGNPELGWIENGVVKNCHDLNAENTTGYFCRILAGAWRDWFTGMKVQKSDTVVSNGRLYRVKAKADGTVYTSYTQPVHEAGEQVLDGICWVMVQSGAVYGAGVRNVTFRDIFLEKARTAHFSIHFDNDKYSRSYYPDAEIPVQEQLVFDNIRVLHNENNAFLSIETPVDTVHILNSFLRDSRVVFYDNGALKDYGKTVLTISRCQYFQDKIVENGIKNKKIELHEDEN